MSSINQREILPFAKQTELAAKAGFSVMELHVYFDGWKDAYGFETESGDHAAS